jgi:hypothetical protein
MGTRTGKPRGRPPGSKSSYTKEREKALKETAKKLSRALPGAFDGDAHALLMAVYKDPSQEWKLRINAAVAAIRYEKPALASIDHKGKVDSELGVTFTWQPPA